jgi:hypothetical protein
VRAQALRVVTAVVWLGAVTSCTGGVDAGEDGGFAFIVLSVMLLAILGILWLVLGRED